MGCVCNRFAGSFAGISLSLPPVSSSQCDGSPGKEEATFNMLVEFKTLPPKKPNTTPKFIIDVYDNKGVCHR